MSLAAKRCAYSLQSASQLRGTLILDPIVPQEGPGTWWYPLNTPPAPTSCTPATLQLRIPTAGHCQGLGHTAVPPPSARSLPGRVRRLTAPASRPVAAPAPAPAAAAATARRPTRHRRKSIKGAGRRGARDRRRDRGSPSPLEQLGRGQERWDRTVVPANRTVVPADRAVGPADIPMGQRTGKLGQGISQQGQDGWVRIGNSRVARM